MSRVLGRTDDAGATGHLGAYRAQDSSCGASVAVDLDRPHAGLVVGKRGYGKSYTLGVFAEALARTAGVVPVVVDPMGGFSTLAELDADIEVVDRPTVAACALAPRAWSTLLGLSLEGGPGALVWQAAAAADTVTGMREHVECADADAETRRAAANHLDLAMTWEVFDPDGLTATDLLNRDAVVLDLSGFDEAPMNALLRAVADSLYRYCVRQEGMGLPWLLVDEAHVFFDGVAESALRTVVTRGRQPGVSLLAATQRPSALPDVAVSQADLLVSHRLTSRSDIDALARARPTYVDGELAGRMPNRPGDALVVDDATESVHTVSVRNRETPHGGGSPRASARTTNS